LHRQYGYNSDEALAFVLTQAAPLSGRILEIGSGKGRLLTALLRRGYRITTVDVDSGEQRFARLNVAYECLSDRVQFVQADATCLPFMDECFDTVVSMNALHHFTDWRALLREVFRVVETGGKLVLSDLDETGFEAFDRLHRDEGRVHARCHYEVDQIADEISRQAWQVRIARGHCQWILTALLS
jgi:ubiquinone/menaquinone biosynthesis C-methylase UbiE